MTELKNQLFRPDFNKEINIESIISAPLVAASKANVSMVTGQTRFLLDFCFKKNEVTDTHEPIMIKMSIMKAELNHDKDDKDDKNDKSDPDAYLHQHIMTFSVPLLTIVPINSLAIDMVKIDFDMEITSVTSYNSEHKILDKQAQLHGRISSISNNNSNDPNQDKKQTSSRLKVSVNASPLPLPVGVLTIIDMYAKAIQPYSKDSTKPNQINK